jgi:hypothetical protein
MSAHVIRLQLSKKRQIARQSVRPRRKQIARPRKRRTGLDAMLVHK